MQDPSTPLRSSHHCPSAPCAPSDVQATSLKLQQGITECCFNPFVPRTFQRPIQSEALEAAIVAIGDLGRASLEETVQYQQEQLRQIQGALLRMEQAIAELTGQTPERSEASSKPELSFRQDRLYENGCQL